MLRPVPFVTPKKKLVRLEFISVTVWRGQLCLWKEVAPASGLIGVRSHEPDSAVKRQPRAQSGLSKRYGLIPA